MEDPRPRYKKQSYLDEEFLGKGAGCGEWIDADMEDPWYLVTIITVSAPDCDDSVDYVQRMKKR